MPTSALHHPNPGRLMSEAGLNGRHARATTSAWPSAVHQSRLGVAFWKHHPMADQSASSLVAATLAFHRATRGDLVKLTPAGNYQVAGRGAHADWCGDALGRRTFRARAITAAAHWTQLSATLTPMEWEMVSAARGLRQALGPDVPLFATVFPPLTQALMLAGPDRLQVLLDAAPDAARAGLDMLTCGTEQLIAAYQDAGVNGIYLAAQHMTENILPLELYRRLGWQYDSRVMAACDHFDSNILHIHGAAIFLEGVPRRRPWAVHYELGPGNPSPEQYSAACACPAVIGLPFDVWDAGAGIRQVVDSTLLRFGQNNALLTSPCVVPLAIQEARIATWIEALRHAY